MDSGIYGWYTMSDNIKNIKSEVMILISSVNSRVYPAFNDSRRIGQPDFVAVDAQIINQETMKTGVKNTGLIKVLVVSESTYGLDNLAGIVYDVCKDNAELYKTFHYSRITNLSETLTLKVDQTDYIARTFDIRGIWFE